MKKLKDFDVKGKRVLVRCDFNVPLDAKGKVQDDFRIRKTLPTIEYLIKNKAKVVLMSHLEIEGKAKENLSLASVGEKLNELGVKTKKLNNCTGKEVEKEASLLKEGSIVLLENLRFNEGEKKNDPKFSKSLAKLGDIYINDAFSVCHRNHASIVGITKYLPSGAGFLLEKEVNVLSKVLQNPWRPLVSIIGGAKIESKTKLITELLKQSDHVLIGGKIANAVLAIKGICIGRELPEQDIVKEVQKIEITSTKFHLPIDVLVSPNASGDVYVRESAPAKARTDELILDIGPETIKLFCDVIACAKMIVWSGPMGYSENPLFKKGTKEIAKAIAKNHQAYRIAGGGDTLFALSKLNLLDKFDHVSTGGGAMLSFLSREKLPGLVALDKKDNG
jgi:phosphoglycerate kinase